MKFRGIVGFLLFGVIITGFFVQGALGAEADPYLVFTEADDAFADSRYNAAYDLYISAMEGFAHAGDTTMEREAFLKAKRSSWIMAEMTLNQTSAEELLATEFPDMSVEEHAAFLTPDNAIQIVSDGETWYYEGLARNIRYHNPWMMQEINEKKGESPFYDQILPFLEERERTGSLPEPVHTYIASGAMTLPTEILGDTGTLKVWIPLPIETAYQGNITVLSVEPADYVVSEPVTTGDIGYVYLEVPVQEIDEDELNFSVVVQFTVRGIADPVDPDAVGEYDTTSELYQQFTSSQPNINVSEEIRELAESIVGEETNPYRKARLIYDYIITTLPYSNVPHSYLAAAGVAESDFVHSTGFGDCGTQSSYFAALCRAVGVPARTPGGYQLFPGHEGTHFWAEFYLPNYGWLPVDVTIAEGGDWVFGVTDEERQQYKDYFFGSIDPYRMTIQNDMDARVLPDPGEELIFTIVMQLPAAVLETSNEDIEATVMGSWKYSFRNSVIDEA